MTKTKINYSYAYLLISFIFLFFFNGRWILPIAAFIVPIFLIRFLRFQKPVKGFLIIIVAGWISNIFIWKGMMPMSGFFYYFLMLMMSVFNSLTFLIDRVFFQKFKGIISTLVFPSAYVFMEFIVVSTNPSGSYGALSHTQTSLPLIQIISVTGIWGVSFVILWTASVINWLWDNAFDKYSLSKALWVYVIPVTIIILYGQIRLALGTAEGTVKIASINIPKDKLKHIYNDHPDSINEQINKSFLDQCHIAATSKAKIVFGVEVMLNITSDIESEYLAKAKTAAEKDNIYIGLPFLIYSKDNPRLKPMNKITWISPQGEILFTYYKAKPTPGEGSYGDGVLRYFDSPYGRISSSICFDMDFPSLIKQVDDMGIDIMLVPGNDWQEITPYHTYVASTRAIEHGFNMVRAASRGLSASFNYKGEILSSMNYFKTDDIILYSDVPTKGQKTIYSVLGNYFAWLCILFFVLISFISIKINSHLAYGSSYRTFK
ncbi:MAG TPA: nitrilase-related carbon-nitrogen hydrolase [Ignavibacteriaceae bacterium]|nr:nitrilase-related carbon-nitrogen hydrolase [Ignavibacteriaceae bacterium]